MFHEGRGQCEKKSFAISALDIARMCWLIEKLGGSPPLGERSEVSQVASGSNGRSVGSWDQRPGSVGYNPNILHL